MINQHKKKKKKIMTLSFIFALKNLYNKLALSMLLSLFMIIAIHAIRFLFALGTKSTLLFNKEKESI